MYGDCISSVLRNNKRYQELRQIIKTDFESEGIPMVSINPPPTASPAIYDTIYWPLFNWWKEKNLGKKTPSPDFTQIETTTDFGSKQLMVAGWRSGAIAYAETDSDKQQCKRAISKIAENQDYEQEATSLIEIAHQLVADIRAFREQLIDTLEDIGKYWPGTRAHKFKEESNCTRCKELFH